MRRYANLPWHRRKIEAALNVKSSGRADHAPRPPRHIQHRLTKQQTEALVNLYRQGIKVMDLAAMFHVHRATVLKIAQRHKLPQHRLKLTPDKVEQAAQLYRSGKSLSTIGAELGVHASTVHAALLKVGVTMRDSHGQRRSS